MVPLWFILGVVFGSLGLLWFARLSVWGLLVGIWVTGWVAFNRAILFGLGYFAGRLKPRT